ncbi:amylovoran biosynthesis protein AmsE [Snodgrassella alvi]|uniref:glycosyltransferase n=1 Tax=Snodgrassella TaxID=1193515 RepID=UPI000A062500|nr:MULTISPECIES: glycosyltransferase [Snodgrassella]MBI0181126.1 glycosyltransferase [Snodgrassella sp. W8158]ORF05313.1 amylovoran biosynthesis protein AmsE [Snodgrassella alvi]ORF10718.1 amylovoran biosynthesis protein AmsE [Snodgrassella alvi]ORF17083.1 amylovoran biosynthesis protein AmsE [Snodgrassella alvi]ORF17657.1 amylovoran biosynthesis protein AmsE [Snodgrassella alvi]
MKTRPFSVLLSLYAQEHPDWLSACLESLCTQSIQADEIIMVLDGAVGTELHSVLNSYQTRLPLKIVPLPQHVGLGHALNAGLEHCRHEWIMRMDTDDICAPGRFEYQWAYILENPDIALFSGQIAEFSTTPELSGTVRQVPLTDSAIRHYAQWRNPINHMAAAYRKSAVQAVGGYQHHQWMEDYNLWLRLLAAGYQAANLPETLVYARAGHNMHARRRGLRYLRSEWQLLRLKHRLKSQPLLPALSCFALRGSSRLLPTSLLGNLYQHLRLNK